MEIEPLQMTPVSMHATSHLGETEKPEETKVLQGNSSRLKRVEIQHSELNMVDPVPERLQGVGAPGLETHRQI